MNDNQIAIYCEAIRDTTIRQFYKIQNQRKEISMLHKKCKSQQAEIERLERHTEMYHEVRAEAVKEFAERLKEKAWHGMWETINHVDVDEIDNLVKEMVGEQNVPCN